MKPTFRTTAAALAVGTLAVVSLTACEDDGDGVDDDVEQDIEEDLENIDDTVDSVVDDVQEEIDGEPDDTGG
jgi:hypothetical protein